MARRLHFLTTLSKDEAIRRFREVVRPEPLGSEDVPIASAHGRILAADVWSAVDLPPFDRSVVDGYAVVASDTFGASEESGVVLELAAGAIAAGQDPRDVEVSAGRSVEVATGAPIPRGANAVAMVEHCEASAGTSAPLTICVQRALVPGQNIQRAGSDVRAGELLFRRGQVLMARETGVLAAIGVASLPVVRRPRVAIGSTGDELVPPGGALGRGAIFDSNARVVADLVRENGCEPVELGIARDTEESIGDLLRRAREHDVVVLSGGTSKGAGDLTFRLVASFAEPGVVVHGAAVRPGKPIVLAAWGRTPVVILPGFPTSAVITFDVFVRPILRRLAGLPEDAPRGRAEARLAVPVPKALGRHEYVLTHILEPAEPGSPPLAFPLLKGSGSVAAFAQADGFFEIAAERDRLEQGARVDVTMLAAERRPADLVVIGSHCPGIDAALAILQDRTGLRAKVVSTGSRAGIDAVRRGEADLAPAHLLDPETGRYNVPFAAGGGRGGGGGGSDLVVIRGYDRLQGIVSRRPSGSEGEARDRACASDRPAEQEPVARIARFVDARLRILNRNRGSGTRALLDLLLDELARRRGVLPEDLRRSIPGFDVDAHSHGGLAAAVAAGKADWGVAIASVARHYGLAFEPLREEELDLVVARPRLARPAVRAFLEVLRDPVLHAKLAALDGYRVPEAIGTPRGEG